MLAWMWIRLRDATRRVQVAARDAGDGMEMQGDRGGSSRPGPGHHHQGSGPVLRDVSFPGHLTRILPG